MKLDIYYDSCYYDMLAVRPTLERCFSRTLHFFNVTEMQRFFKDIPEDTSWDDILQKAVDKEVGHIHAVL